MFIELATKDEKFLVNTDNIAYIRPNPAGESIWVQMVGSDMTMAFTNSYDEVKKQLKIGVADMLVD